MQIPYHIKVCLQDYYTKFDKWTVPDFSDKCPICGGADCARYHGFYTRIAICPKTGFSVLDLAVMRFLCYGVGDTKTCDHITFSLLPFELVPFLQLPLKFMVLATWIRLSRSLSLTDALNTIEDELNNLGDIADFINISTMRSWERMIMSAVTLFISIDIDIVPESQYEQLDSEGLMLFLKILIHHKSTISDHPIRGPDAFAWDFYQQCGGTDQCALFLFGQASQHRR
jgi:hypothetical protein